jgi:hypothetical protein
MGMTRFPALRRECWLGMLIAQVGCNSEQISPRPGLAGWSLHLRGSKRQRAAFQDRDRRDARPMVILALARAHYSHSQDRWRY